MAYQVSSNPDDEENGASGSGQQTVAAGGGAADTTATAGTGAGSTTGTRQDPGPSGGFFDYNNVLSQNQNANTAPVLDPIRQYGTNAKTGIQTARSNFDAAAGPDDFWDQSKQDTEYNAIDKGGDYIAPAQQYLNARYTGPMELDDSPFKQALSQYGDTTNRLGSQSGIDSVLQQTNPQETSGQRAFDSFIYGNNQNFKNQAQGLKTDYNQTQSDADTAKTWAHGRALERQSQEANIASSANQYVNQKKNDILQGVDAQAGRNNAVNNAFLTQFQNIRAGTADNPYANNYTVGPQNVDSVANPANTDEANLYGQLKNYKDTVNAGQYVNYNPGMYADRSNSAFDPQIRQYSNIERLLKENGVLGSGWQAGSLGFDQNGFNTAKGAADAKAAALANRYNSANLAAPMTAAPDAASQLATDHGGGDNEGGRGGKGTETVGGTQVAGRDASSDPEGEGENFAHGGRYYERDGRGRFGHAVLTPEFDKFARHEREGVHSAISHGAKIGFGSLAGLAAIHGANQLYHNYANGGLINGETTMKMKKRFAEGGEYSENDDSLLGSLPMDAIKDLAARLTQGGSDAMEGARDMGRQGMDMGRHGLDMGIDQLRRGRALARPAMEAGNEKLDDAMEMFKNLLDQAGEAGDSGMQAAQDAASRGMGAASDYAQRGMDAGRAGLSAAGQVGRKGAEIGGRYIDQGIGAGRDLATRGMNGAREADKAIGEAGRGYGYDFGRLLGKGARSVVDGYNSLPSADEIGSSAADMGRKGLDAGREALGAAGAMGGHAVDQGIDTLRRGRAGAKSIWNKVFGDDEGYAQGGRVYERDSHGRFGSGIGSGFKKAALGAGLAGAGAYALHHYIPQAVAWGARATFNPGYASGGQVDVHDFSGLLDGPGDGQSDSIQAKGKDGSSIGLSDGEYVVPAQAVSIAGNGSTDAGANLMDQLVQALYDKGAGGKQMDPIDTDKLNGILNGNKRR